MEVSGDERMNDGLREEVQGVRGGMLGAAEAYPLPPRFKAEPHPDEPSMIITDSESGRSTTVSLYAYGNMRRALNDLFGEDGGQ